jgi:hypothetical protein
MTCGQAAIGAGLGHRKVLGTDLRPVHFPMIKTDIRNQPAYTVAEAARHLKVAPATVRSWTADRTYPRGAGAAHSSPLICPSKNSPPTLSFWNLIEAHVVRSLRTDHTVEADALRAAIRYVEQTLRVERLLVSPELSTEAGQLLLDRYGQMIELSASRQVAMRRRFTEHLARLEWDEWKFPVRLFPFTSSDVISSARSITINAKVAFGRPVLAQKGICDPGHRRAYGRGRVRG